MDLSEGDVVATERTFSVDDVRAFADLTGDRGSHHLETDEEGRVLVHGLLTASLGTEIGGRYDVLARTIEFEFHRPVYTGETVRCEAEFVAVEPAERGVEVEAEMTYTRLTDREVVLTGAFDGVVAD